MRKPIDLSNLDKSVSPRKDFYHYANGGWIKKHPIPDEFSRYGTFDVLREENKELVKSLIEEVSKITDPADHIASLVGNFYRSGMDMDNRNALGFQPIREELVWIEGLEKKEDISGIITEFYKRSQPTLFYIYPSSDHENSEMIIAHLYQGGMGLSDVDYYRNEDHRSAEIRLRYKEYIARMFVMTGIKPEEAASKASVILDIESRLAHAGMTRLEQRDPHKTHNKRSIAELTKEAPLIDWKTLFGELDLDIKDYVNVGQPDFFVMLSRIIDEISIEDWKSYFSWRLLNSTASLLSEDFEKEKFAFYGSFLSGKKSQQQLWKRVLATTEDALGEAIGRLFVKKYFPPEAKERMLKLIENLRASLKEKIENLAWMSDDTKLEALEKLSKIAVKIGYPDKWRSFDELHLTGNSYYHNSREAAIFNMKYEFAKIGKLADKDEWHMTPQTVNAYYHPFMNEIVFPAGILQPPFFFKDADDAVNYGAIGVVIGHEMTHGFDDQGRKFDKQGNLNDWWKTEDAERFSERAKVLEEQFNKIKVTNDLYADGKLSLGENIADLGGINIALDALKMAWNTTPPETETDGFTPVQRFFLSYAHLWANNIREKEMIRLTKEDVHSLGINRVNGPLPNVESFHEAFGVKEGDKMYLPEGQRADIW